MLSQPVYDVNGRRLLRNRNTIMQESHFEAFI